MDPLAHAYTYIPDGDQYEEASATSNGMRKQTSANMEAHHLLLNHALVALRRFYRASLYVSIMRESFLILCPFFYSLPPVLTRGRRVVLTLILPVRIASPVLHENTLCLERPGLEKGEFSPPISLVFRSHQISRSASVHTHSM